MELPEFHYAKPPNVSHNESGKFTLSVVFGSLLFADAISFVTAVLVLHILVKSMKFQATLFKDHLQRSINSFLHQAAGEIHYHKRKLSGFGS
jgi:hypothetical protein